MNIMRLAGLAVALVVSLLFAVFVGDQGPWYFAWVVGTVMIILIAGAGAILLDAQDEQASEREI
ncbi:hypothetical protein AA0242T_2951 [Acetobacter aceti NRIC 0242]|jgi:predicted outer membrane lipoprotein|uniref:Uncharacterized protein n=1 Tax=Acetobacter aceti NBRC 14818 TaxID=887700 RepID=A0AB33IEU2_ACEAC|nr:MULTISPECIES: hypothetical protein [Acetobacteraceae]GBO82249.1 hypothetical protein AA0242T_2951 [Acetobacter aceti NRIC 0242]MBF0851792.1 hypothetical protein [Gluconobacter sp. R75690]MBF0880505.1 hypothetical protein [Gluconobacter sp. R75828]TCS31115.1 hypothetical protein EDC15_11743 [Acetobacter aceti NBRC 14818]BCK76675.1 hypothetical protein EMQ_2281 [Acetobacter aceti NBRC 14818]